MQSAFLDKFKSFQQNGKIKPDPLQMDAAILLQELQDALDDYHPKNLSGLSAAVTRWRGGKRPAPKGVYMHGGVGRGKSMLMDLFFATTPTPQKRRAHFHEFMADVHHRLHIMRKQKPDLADPLKPLAEELAREAWLLCFDEFLVQDIADAMILSRLFGALFDCGVVVVATSNVAPQDLYKNGLQRERFLPFIPVLENHLRVFEFKGGVDYRTARISEIDRYNTPLGQKSEAALALAFHTLTDHEAAHPVVLSVKGHDVVIPRAAKGTAFCSFADLCEKNYGAGDYLELTRNFHNVILSGIPRLSGADKNAVKRFITLIDVLYDNKIKLICSAEVPVLELYQGSDHGFEFQRTESRLLEMQSKDYLAGT